VLGRSGSGKSIAIKCLVGLVKADKGEIRVFGKDITNFDEHQLNEIRLRIGFLFQNGALYDSMTVRENLAFPLRRHSKELSSKEVDDAIKETLESVGWQKPLIRCLLNCREGCVKELGLLVHLF